MKNERLLLADDSETSLFLVSGAIELYGAKDGHEIVGKAASVDEVEALLEDGLKPTVALVDNSFPQEGDGQRAAEIIRRLSPGTIIISYSSEEGLTWGGVNWKKDMDARALTDKLTELQH